MDVKLLVYIEYTVDERTNRLQSGDEVMKAIYIAKAHF